MMEAHDCNFHDALRVCINSRCPLHRAMRNLAANLRIVGALFASFRAGDNYGFHMGEDSSQCDCQWRPGSGEPYRVAERCAYEYQASEDARDERDALSLHASEDW